MTQLQADCKDFLRLLNAHRVEYLLIGGYAVGVPPEWSSRVSLRRNKRAAGRNKDLDDLENLPGDDTQR